MIAIQVAHGANSAISSETEIVIVTGSCCDAAVIPLDEQAKQSVAKAIAALGLNAKIRILTAGEAIAGSLPVDILAHLQVQMERNGLQPPLVMVGVRVIASGAISPGEIETILQAEGERRA